MKEKVKAHFIPPMLLRRTAQLPDDGGRWEYQIKLDGYRSIAFKSSGHVCLRSRNNKNFALRYSGVAKALSGIPDETVLDGELVVLDASGHPSFNALQHLGKKNTPVYFYVFDLLVLAGRDVMRESFAHRQELLRAKVLPKLKEPIRYLTGLDADLSKLMKSVQSQGLEGLVAKRKDSPYQPGERGYSWLKMRLNLGQEFVIGGYTIGNPFDAIVFGFYEGKKLIYAARTRNGFTPATRAALFRKFKGLEIPDCPFINLPESKTGRWGQGLTAAKMKDCRWLKPVLVGQFEFLEWTGENHLRHSRFIALRDDKKARDVVRES